MNKKALSPLMATVILVVFALVVGTITMNWGKSYVDNLGEDKGGEVKTGSVLINYKDVDTDLKKLQLEHLLGQITQEQYLEREKEII